MKYLILVLLLATVIGECLRLPFGASLVDFALLVTVFFWSVQRLLFVRKLRLFPGAFALLGFLLVGIFSLFWNVSELGLSLGETASSLLYWLRFTLFSFLILIAFNFEKKEKDFVLNGFFFTSFLIFLLGILQLKFFPNFEVLGMEEKGWDPHIGRLLSTWFDPNFLGGYFAFVSTLACAKIFTDFKRKKINYFLIFLLLCLLAGILLTYSRSALLALLVSFGVFGLFLSRKLLVVGIVIFLLGLGVSERFSERFFDGVKSAKAIFLGEGNLDPTAQLRLKSWQTGIKIFEEKPLTGVGFNTLKEVQKKKWSFIGEGHGSSGIDSSILTVAATTGIFGLLFFLIFLSQIFWNFLKSFLKEKNYLALGALAGFSGILVHSIFVNSFFFYLFLPSFFIGIGLFLDKKLKK